MSRLGYTKNEIDRLTPHFIQKMLLEIIYDENLAFRRGILEVNYGFAGKVPKELNNIIDNFFAKEEKDNTNYDKMKEDGLKAVQMLQKEFYPNK